MTYPPASSGGLAERHLLGSGEADESLEVAALLGGGPSCGWMGGMWRRPVLRCLPRKSGARRVARSARLPSAGHGVRCRWKRDGSTPGGDGGPHRVDRGH